MVSRGHRLPKPYSNLIQTKVCVSRVVIKGHCDEFRVWFRVSWVTLIQSAGCIGCHVYCIARAIPSHRAEIYHESTIVVVWVDVAPPNPAYCLSVGQEGRDSSLLALA